MFTDLGLRILLLLVLAIGASTASASCQTAEPSPPPPRVPLDSATFVIQVQQALKDQALLSVEATGLLDEATIEAIKAYQKKQGLFVDGLISEVLLARLLWQPQLEENSLLAKSGLSQGQFKADELKDAAEINRADAQGWTPLLYASLSGSSQRLAALLKAGADVDQASAYGTTPLMVAVSFNRAEVLRQLLRQWPILELADHKGEIVEEMAFRQGRNGLLNQFQRQRVAMLAARMRRIPPFKVRMVTWDAQECYVARESKIEVVCDIQPQCNQERNTLVLCADKGQALHQQIAEVVQKTWGGRTRVLDGRLPDYAGPFACQPDDVVVFGVRH
ncbi:MAG: ankyrin repeat domain-containing protein [Gammaproteobacteria bacterium]|nr:ankyrin repeat domain-containing protein [Gammaproteobacteria bacterium]